MLSTVPKGIIAAAGPLFKIVCVIVQMKEDVEITSVTNIGSSSVIKEYIIFQILDLFKFSHQSDLLSKEPPLFNKFKIREKVLFSCFRVWYLYNVLGIPITYRGYA